jgi:hypothetical protein
LKLSPPRRGSPPKPITVVTPQYYVQVQSVTTLHTRARTNDTLWISMITAFGDQMPDWSQDCLSVINSACAIADYGNVQNGVHIPFENGGPSDANWNNFQTPSPVLALPTVLSATSSELIEFVFSIAVWNYGFDQLVISPNDPMRAHYDAVEMYVDRPLTSGQYDISAPLNNHPWAGCDGPVFGILFRFTPDEMAQMTQSGNSTQTVGPVTIRSQVGCGASSKYTVTFTISKG